MNFKRIDSSFKSLTLAQTTLVAMVAPFASFLSANLVSYLTWSGVTFAALLFCSILLNPRTREGFSLVNHEMSQDAANRGRKMSLLDAKWGLFGKRMGGPTLLIVRGVLVTEMLISQWQFGHNRQPTFLIGASHFVALELSMLFAVDSTLAIKETEAQSVP